MFKPQTIQLSWLPLIASSHWQSILPHPTELTTSSYPSATKILTTQRISTLANPALSLSQIVSKHSGTYYSYISLWDSMYKNSAYLPNHGDLGDSYQASPVTMVAINTPHAKQIISFASTSQSQAILAKQYIYVTAFAPVFEHKSQTIIYIKGAASGSPDWDRVVSSGWKWEKSVLWIQIIFGICQIWLKLIFLVDYNGHCNCFGNVK